MNYKSLSPVLCVEHIEPCLELWEQRLGFTRLAEVPHDGRLGFVLLQRDGVQIMYQSWDSVAADVAELAEGARSGREHLFIEVQDLAAVERQLTGVPYVVPKRDTFYGMTEVIIRDPAGHVIVFAQPQAAG